MIEPFYLTLNFYCTKLLDMKPLVENQVVNRRRSVKIGGFSNISEIAK